MNFLKPSRRVVLLSLAACAAGGCQTTEASPSAAASASASASVSVSTPVPVSAAVSAPVPESVPASVSASASASAFVPAVVASSAPAAGPCPAEMSKVGRTCVDTYEAHLVVVSPEGTEESFPHYQRPETGPRYEARSSADVFPQAYISRVESAAACKNSGKRLCSRDEWLRACEGREHFLYPYGHRAQSGRCNSGKLHLLPKLFGNNARAWKYDEAFNSPLLNQEPGYLAKTGAYTECASEAGVLDLVGNLHEWVSDTVTEDIEERLSSEKVERREQPWTAGNGIFMGGFFSTTNELGAGCYYTTIAHEPSYHDYSTGFRCCKDAAKPPQPVKPAR